MYHFIVSLVVKAVLVLLAAYITPGIKIKSFGTALWFAFLLAVLNPVLGWLFTAFFQVLTLGVFWLFGLTFILQFLAFTLVIRVIEGFTEGFKTEGFGNAMAFALVLDVLISLVAHMMGGSTAFPAPMHNAFV